MTKNDIKIMGYEYFTCILLVYCFLTEIRMNKTHTHTHTLETRSVQQMGTWQPHGWTPLNDPDRPVRQWISSWLSIWTFHWKRPRVLSSWVGIPQRFAMWWPKCQQGLGWWTPAQLSSQTLRGSCCLWKQMETTYMKKRCRLACFF